MNKRTTKAKWLHVDEKFIKSEDCEIYSFTDESKEIQTNIKSWINNTSDDAIRLFDRMINEHPLKESEGMCFVLSKNVYDLVGKKKYKERIANLTGTNASISVAGITDSECDERLDLYDDAVKACQSALKDGVLPGAGVALFRASKNYTGMIPTLDSNQKGKALVINLLPKTFEWLHKEVDKTLILGQPFMFTYNAKTNKYGLGTDINVLDSCKTVKSSLINSVSVALTVLTSGKYIENVR